MNPVHPGLREIETESRFLQFDPGRPATPNLRIA
jgi:hypothetical protein